MALIPTSNSDEHFCEGPFEIPFEICMLGCFVTPPTPSGIGSGHPSVCYSAFITSARLWEVRRGWCSGTEGGGRGLLDPSLVSRAIQKPICNGKSLNRCSTVFGFGGHIRGYEGTNATGATSEEQGQQSTLTHKTALCFPQSR